MLVESDPPQNDFFGIEPIISSSLVWEQFQMQDVALFASWIGVFGERTCDGID